MKLIIQGTAPSVNHMYENRESRYRNKQGKPKMRRIRVLSDAAANYKTYGEILTTSWINKNKWHKADGKVIVNLWYYLPDNVKRDTHNGLKLLLDIFENAGVYTNDYYALPRVIDFEIDKKDPRIEIEFIKVTEVTG